MRSDPVLRPTPANESQRLSALRSYEILDTAMDVMVWLRRLGLGKYEAVFRENEIDETVLPNLTAFSAFFGRGG